MDGPGKEPATPVEFGPTAARDAKSNRLLMLVIRMLFMVLLVAVTLLTLASQRQPGDFNSATFVGLLVAAAALGLVIVLVDAITPNKRLASVVAVYLGICFGLIGALAVGALIDTVARAWELERGPAAIYIQLAKGIVGITLCYLSVSVVLSTKDDLRLVIPYVEFSRQLRGVQPLVVDTSVLIDGRLDGLGQTGFLDAPLIVPQFVIDELQTLADSGDRTKRSRGRRGLETVKRLQANPHLDLSVEERRVEGVSVDHKIIELVRGEGYRILTTDANLRKVAEIKGISVLDLNALAGTMRTTLGAGDRFSVELVKPGENPGQAVGYLADGTMVVVEQAADRVGQTVAATISNTLQTSAGRLVFAKPIDADPESATAAETAPPADGPNHAAAAEEPTSRTADMARAATGQPRVRDRPKRHDPPPAGRNPRR